MEKLVYRHIALPVSAFDHLKDYQRAIEARDGKRPSNSETLVLILKDHRNQTAARAGRDHVETSKRR